MDQNVSEARNRTPVNLGMKGFQMTADPLRGFAERLEIAQNGVLHEFRPAKGCLGILTILIDAPDAIEDVMDIKAVVFHNGTAS